MQNATHRISLDIHDTASQAVISVKKGDSKRKIVAIFTENGKPYPIDADCTAAMRFKKPDGTVVYSICSVGLSGVVCGLTTQTTAAVGSVGCEITLYGADKKQITSPRFEMIVDDTLYSDSEVESSNEFTALTQAMAQFGGVSGATQRAEAAAEAATTAKENASESASIALISQETAQTAAATATEKAAAAEASAAQAAQQALVVNFTDISGSPTFLNSSKTFDEVKAALNANKAVIACYNSKTYAIASVNSSQITFYHADIPCYYLSSTDKYSVQNSIIYFASDYAYVSKSSSDFCTASQTRMDVIYSTTLAEATTEIIVSKSSSNESFSLDRVAIYMKLPSSITLKINEFSVYFNNLVSSNRVYAQTSQTGCRYFYFIGERIGNDDIHVWDCCASIAAAAANMANQRRLVSLGAASSIIINSNVSLPVGTQVLICGRRATQ